MARTFSIIVSVVIGLIAFVSTASIGGKFDYTTADEERQQKYLDNVANGFTSGFRLSAGKSAEITRVFADSEVDLISVSINYLDQRIDKLSSSQIQKQMRWMTKQSCKIANKQGLLDNEITLRLRMYRPSGSQMGTVQVDNKSCAKHIT